MANSIRQSLLATLDPNRRASLIWRNRVRYLMAQDEQFALAAGPRFYLHLIPLTTETFCIDRNNQQIAETVRNVRLLFGHYAHNYRINIDGFLNYMSGRAESEMPSYCQVFWDGSIEMCDKTWLKEPTSNPATGKIHLPSLETKFVTGLQSALLFMKSIQVPLPIYVCFAILGARGWSVTASRYPSFENNLIDRDDLFFDPIVFDNWDADLGKSLKPLFDQLWNAGNFLRSFSYDENGNWKPRSD